MRTGSGHGNPMWVLARVCADEVYLDDRPGQYVYRIHGAAGEFDKTCCDAIFALADAGQVVLKRGEKPAPTA